MKNQTPKQINKNAVLKAFIAALIAPLFIFVSMLFVNMEISFVAVGVWLAFASFVYKTSKDKQVTAYYFFKILSYESAFLLPVVALISTALYVSHYN